MDRIAATLLLAVLLLETVSHLALKSASVRAGSKSGVRYLMTFIAQPVFWLAATSFVALFLAWLAFLSRVPLGQGVMAGSITIVGVMLGGRLWFKEYITLPRATAIALIAFGVALVGWGHA
jgi:drug/metabolite transporter (DMT)-like permease